MIAIMFESDLPNMATHCKQSGCGFSIHKGVLVQWDEDHDTRVLEFIDAMPVSIREGLLVVQEHEGGLGFIWDSYVPWDYKEGDNISEPGGDMWCIHTSLVADIFHPKPHDDSIFGKDGEYSTDPLDD